ncbi:metalloregulator ArsR/SmtB family transcription factor [Nocardia sp. NPDC051463]|uniref:metalloregulator ArsR/SmtB family transcription factor n=1 Tax=Nocardia sp. NPDC051463 TaxID=3154845 RepID=UPI00344CE534
MPTIDVSAPICRTPVAAAPVDDRAALGVTLRLKALADPVRVKLMSLLAQRDGSVNTRDLAAAVGLAESTASHRLGQLRNSGLVESPRQGRSVQLAAGRDALSALCFVLDPECCR